ncbi:MAG: histidine phosphatase family protein [Desulfovibrio sp.]|uniref:histidine phosphatase family protein n=1 Tax=Desulfovibrio sp. 7SRBS1 TaxID=3378064 RepID=UPI003B3FA079
MTNRHPTRILLIRHALTPWNVARRIQGVRDIPLCAQGVRMAAEWSKSPLLAEVSAICTSPLSRAHETGRIIGRKKGMCPLIVPQLVEQDWGEWDGLPLQSLHTKHAAELKIQADKGWEFQPPNGESRAQTRDRALAALAKLAAQNTGQTTLVVTHNSVLRCILYHYLGMPFTEDQPIRLSREYAVHTLVSQNGDLHLANYGVIL